MPHGRGPSHCWLALAAATTLAGAACGCQPECGEEQNITYAEGQTDPTRTIYQTTPVTGPLLHFPPQRTYFLVHDLRTDPWDVRINLAFVESGLKLNLAPSAGNMSVWHVDPKDRKVLVVTNDSCAEFYLHVVAYAPPDPGLDVGDAGSD